MTLHGGSLMLLRREDAPLLDPNRSRAAPPNANDKPDALRDGERISVEELAALRASDTPLRILDVRSDTSFASSESLAAGALRVSAVQAVQRMTGTRRAARQLDRRILCLIRRSYQTRAAQGGLRHVR